MDRIQINKDIKAHIMDWFMQLPTERQTYFLTAINRDVVSLEMPFEQIALEDIEINPKLTTEEITRAVNEDIKSQDLIGSDIERQVRKSLNIMYRSPIRKDTLVYREGVCAHYSNLDAETKQRTWEEDYTWTREQLTLEEFRIRVLSMIPPQKILSKEIRQQNSILRLYLVLFYMTETKRVEVIERNVQKKRTSKAKKGKKPTSRIVTVKETIYKPILLGSEKDTRESRSTFTRHIESWGVRGHWRTYKSGKKIWIKPQVRGNTQKAPQPKTYVLPKK